jgi:NAD(P)-dependent dehydrogenase (short-subunit alcohol dehydrogenase family)
MPELTNNVIIVTGAAQGIGECIARILATDGATLLLADLQEKKVANVAETIREGGARVKSVYVDIADPKLCEGMVTAALKEFGRVDALVNNAGIDAPPGMAWEIDEAHWRKLIDVDLGGAWWCIKAVLPHMMERGKGKIVNISSVVARRGSPMYSVAYSAAKAGLIGLTIGLSVQLERFGILVNAITPGPTGTGTPMTDEQLQAFLSSHPLGIGGPEPIGYAVRYLLRPSCDFMSGAVMNVSGGDVRGI